MIPFETSRSRPRILVADDETIIAMQIGELIEAEGFELAGVAGTAAQAVDMARSLRPDLVLMDIVMPGGGNGRADGLDEASDGIDACALIQSELRIPVVLLTAHGEQHFLNRARRALPSAYLLKPCQNKQIRAAIEVALALSQQHDPAAPFRLREAHHRIKNSFSLLHSMLRIQEIQTTDPAARHSLADAGARVLALAKAHEAMQGGGPESRSDAGPHVERLARALFEAMTPADTPLRLELALEPLGLLPAQVIPCGIFLAEGLTNAIKHAYPGGAAGRILVRLKADGDTAELCVADEGAGLQGDPAELGRNSFGLQCLQAAAEQLEGILDMQSAPGKGTRVCVRFPRWVHQSRSA